MKIVITGLLILVVLLQITLWFGKDGLGDLWAQKQSADSFKKENQKLKQRNDTLQAEVVDLKTKLNAVEERARTDLGLVKKGETFYQIIEEKRINRKNQTTQKNVTE